MSHDFDSPWKPVQTIDIDDDGEGRSHRIFLYETLSAKKHVPYASRLSISTVRAALGITCPHAPRRILPFAVELGLVPLTLFVVYSLSRCGEVWKATADRC